LVEHQEEHPVCKKLSDEVLPYQENTNKQPIEFGVLTPIAQEHIDIMINIEIGS